LAALKEWAIVCNALEDGLQTVLLRKGGILEYKDGFEVKHDSFFLYPTLEHQSREYLQSAYLEKFDRTYTNPINADGQNRVAIRSWAKVERIIEIFNANELAKINDYHIWNNKYLQLRMNYNSLKPLTAMIIRVYKLRSPLNLEIDPKWSGCKSWIDIQVPAYDSLNSSTAINKSELIEPVLIDSEFEKISYGLEEALRS
jgi:hypothetical protein